MALHLITGIAGFIGSSIARALLERGEQVRGIDNLATGKRENIKEIADRIDFREADLLDLDAMKEACHGVECVYHQAAIPSVPKSVLDPLGSNQANVDGTVNILIAARDAKVRRVVYAASSSAYGDTPTLPKRVDMNQTFELLKKMTGYSGNVKYAAERGGDIKHSLADITLATKALGYEPKVNFEEGLQRTVEWYRGQSKAAGA